MGISTVWPSRHWEVLHDCCNGRSYHVYDLELTVVKDNTELRKLLIETRSKSIIVIEGIDCSLNLKVKGRRKQRNLQKIRMRRGKRKLI